ncbi:WSC domain-containing protein ARB_07867-like [Lingula anatina]|uniref:WSC domain-containing protein ARB_07867-like n=1 Tax=Lingula anatina TaxID=7574 RepID=A0A1S3K2K4_LINAN|nr:WSC domain-containing protein ARB_07867-like [Lingula anatina]|eukprot:XP_013416752.1 WSC domain-containing protein ARB_07867-like [Lingula anatina]
MFYFLLNSLDYFTSGSFAGYLGCYKDKDFDERAVWKPRETLKIKSDKMTVRYCVNYCRKGRYKYSGVEHKDECFCGNNDNLMRYSGGKKINESECNQRCKGNKQQICGGDWRMNVYLTGNCSSDWLMTNGSVVRVDKHQGPFLFGDTVSVQCHAGEMVLGPKTAVCTNNPRKRGFAVAWNNTLQCTGIPGYVGCFAATDLRDTINMTMQDMDSSTCIEFCNGTAGYELAVVRHHYCYCGHDNLLGAAGGNCTSPCTGDNTQTCGGETSVSVYRGMGAYQYF